MALRDERLIFEQNKTIYDSARLTFLGVTGYDVYNCSIPFQKDGKTYIYGRVEKRGEWARSTIRLFEMTGKDTYSLVKDSMLYEFEDPCIAFVGDELILGGTHVEKIAGEISTYRSYFYRGTCLCDMVYFTTGPDYMKDIRLTALTNGKIGVFSRPRSEEVMRLYGCESMVGYTEIDSLEELTPETVQNAPLIPDLFGPGEWGGCNQIYTLDTGLLGIIGHLCYLDDVAGQVYMNAAFIYDPINRKLIDKKIIATRSCYPAYDAKKPHLIDVAFSSGIVPREDGKVDLYSGIGDCAEGRVTIDNPFEGYGRILNRFAM